MFGRFPICTPLFERYNLFSVVLTANMISLHKGYHPKKIADGVLTLDKKMHAAKAMVGLLLTKFASMSLLHVLWAPATSIDATYIGSFAHILAFFTSDIVLGPDLWLLNYEIKREYKYLNFKFNQILRLVDENKIIKIK
jgi:hypothetical protein